MGDTIMIFDPSEIRRAIVQAEQQIEIARAEYEKMKSTQQSEIEDLEPTWNLRSFHRKFQGSIPKHQHTNLKQQEKRLN
jgi:hypothetical protein